MKTTDNHNEPKLNIEGVSEHDLKRNVFKTPEGYFDNLTPRVMESVRAPEEPADSPWPVWLKVLTPTIGVSAIALMVWFFIPPTENKSPDFETVLASFSVDELALYAEVESAELIKYDLVDYSQLELTDMTDEELFEYLESEDEIDMNILMNEIEI